jgi:hypothetical protein
VRAILFPEWRDSNRDRNFPFSDSATLIGLTTSGDSIPVPRQMLLDARIQVIGGREQQYLSEIRIAGNQLRFTIKDVNDVACFADYIPGESDDLLELYDAYERAAGVLVIDPVQVQLLFGLNVSSLTFNVESGEFASTCVTPVPEMGVSALLLNNQRLTGDIWLVGGPGVALSIVRSPIGSDQQIIERAFDNPYDMDAAYVIRIDAVGDPYANMRECLSIEGGKVSIRTFLKTINAGGGILGTPDARGNFVITPGSYEAYDNPVRVVSEANGIRVSVVGGT